MAISADLPVRQIVSKHPRAIPTLELFGIDCCYCGQQTLAETCVILGLSPLKVLNQLTLQLRSADAAEEPWSGTKLETLVDYIVKRHHAFARRQLALILNLSVKVERQHGSSHPELFEVSEGLSAISGGLSYHLFCEESILFPHIKKLETGEVTESPRIPGKIQQPISRLLMDHEHLRQQLQLLREITNNFQPPADACIAFNALYLAIAELEQDLQRHIRLENQTLFPQALKQITKLW